MGRHWVEVNVCDGVVFLNELRIGEAFPVALLGCSFGGQNRISSGLDPLF